MRRMGIIATEDKIYIFVSNVVGGEFWVDYLIPPTASEVISNSE